MELEAPLDAFAREQRAGLGALARLSRPGDRELPDGSSRDPRRDPREPGDWDPLPALPWPDGDRPSARQPDIPDVSYGSLGLWR